MRLTHLGHSCLLLEDGGSRVLIDPGSMSPGAEELTDLDAVLITHGHSDHLDAERLPVLLDGNTTAMLITEPEAAVDLTRVGIEARGLHAGQAVTVAGFEVSALGGLHAPVHAEAPRIGNIGLLLRSPGGSTVFHPGDALDAVPPRGSGTVDVLALPVSGSWLSLGAAIDFARAVAPRAVVAVHDAALSPYGRRSAAHWLTQLLGMPVLDGSAPIDLDSDQPVRS
ncbi:MAG: MBL fold metallo-hydrolase [Kineosporiaceae bacterium]|nr:MBL fold metallo-hydrolase [Kineosporiaceae bacterium]